MDRSQVKGCQAGMSKLWVLNRKVAFISESRQNMSEVLTKLETLAISQRQTAQKFGQCQIAIVLTMAKTLGYSLIFSW